MAVLWTAIIVYGLVSAPGSHPKLPLLLLPGADKLIHAVLFAVEAALIMWAFGQFQLRWLAWAVFGWCLLLGAGLELVQHIWVDGRQGTVGDLLADVLGAGLGIFLMAKIAVLAQK